jgi:hypothetical protein
LFKNIQDFFFKRRLIEATKNVVHSPYLLQFEDAKYIGLIVNSVLTGKNLDDLLRIMKLLDEANKTYCLLAICEEKKFPEALLSVPNILISSKKLRNSSIPSEKIIQKLKNENFDILIDMNQGNNKTAFFLMAITKAQLRIGAASPEREPYTDMMVEWRYSDNAFQFFENVVYYLTMMAKPA